MTIKSSLRFAMMLLLIHTIVAVVVYETTLPLGAKLATLLLISMSLVYYLARDAFLFLSDSWCEFFLDQGQVEVIKRDGSKLIGLIANETTVISHFVVLRANLEGRLLPVSCVIFLDALGSGAFRELCVRLRYT